MECCSSENQCGIGGGDCDNDDECKWNLVCGTNNCGSEFPNEVDCCEVRKGSGDPWISPIYIWVLLGISTSLIIRLIINTLWYKRNEEKEERKKNKSMSKNMKNIVCL